jgi:hypothetical protein
MAIGVYVACRVNSRLGFRGLCKKLIADQLKIPRKLSYSFNGKRSIESRAGTRRPGASGRRAMKKLTGQHNGLKG